MSGHDQFSVIKDTARELWRAHCKSCSWVGQDRDHPLDCGEDSIAHTKEMSQLAS